MSQSLKTSFFVIAAIIVVLLGWTLYSNSTHTQGSALTQQFVWAFTPIGSPQGPQTAIVLRIADVDITIGTYAGTCAVIDNRTWRYLENEVSGAVCQTNSGTGTEIGVFDEGAGLVLKQGEVKGTGANVSRENFKQIVKTVQ